MEEGREREREGVPLENVAIPSISPHRWVGYIDTTGDTGIR